MVVFQSLNFQKACTCSLYVNFSHNKSSSLFAQILRGPLWSWSYGSWI